MDTVAHLPAEQRAELFRETGARLALAPALVEKDFWVCWALGHLFDIRCASASTTPMQWSSHIHRPGCGPSST